jgi:hypothetical protein
MGCEKAFPDGAIPRAIVLNLNISPVPDFEDYFTALEVFAAACGHYARTRS